MVSGATCQLSATPKGMPFWPRCRRFQAVRTPAVDGPVEVNRHLLAAPLSARRNLSGLLWLFCSISRPVLATFANSRLMVATTSGASGFVLGPESEQRPPHFGLR